VLNNQIWVVGISVAPIENRYDEALLRFALTSVDSIVVRDEASKVRLRDIGISRRIDVLPDLAFAGDGTSKTAVPREIPKDFIVVSVRPPTGYSRSELNTRELARSLDSLKVDLESEIVFLPFKPDVDIKVSRQVTSEMEYSAEIFEDPDDFREVEGILSEADFLVGMRLHSVILSARNHVPFVGLSYHPKCESVLQQLGTEEVMWCDSFDANKLTARVQKTIQFRRYLRDPRSRTSRSCSRRREEYYPSFSGRRSAFVHRQVHLPSRFSRTYSVIDSAP